MSTQPPRPSNGIPFRVEIPANIQSGQTVRITCPDGTTSARKLPSNVQAGDSMLLELSLHQLKNPKEVLSLLQPDESNYNSTKTKGGGFLDRDIVNVQDVFIALTVGMIIGVGVVFGFVVGILYSTHRVTNTTRHGLPQARLRLETTRATSRISAPGVGMTKKKASTTSSSSTGGGAGSKTQPWTSSTVDRS